MSGFSDILGNEMIKEYFERTLTTGQVSHAYILTGEVGMGRKILAKAFAMTLLCENNRERINRRSLAVSVIPVCSFCRTTIRM